MARTPEVKAMGIKMGVPYFQVKHLVKQGKLVVFSSNYELYADLSRRMMQSIASLVPAIEQYSIDECFADVCGVGNLRQLGLDIRQRVLQWVGIPTCVGIAPTKTLAKFCNHLAKRHKDHFSGVVIWGDWQPDVQKRALASEPVTEIWGIGRRIGQKLKIEGIKTAWDFVNAHTPSLRKKFGVVVERTQREMQGIGCVELHINEENRQNLIRSRSFGKMVTELAPLQSAVTHHITSGAAKLREQGTQAHIAGVFIYTNRFREDLAQYSGHKQIVLPQGSNDTITLNNEAQTLLKAVYRQGYEYKKCGIELGGIEPAHAFLQPNLWLPESMGHPKLMTVWDNIANKFGRNNMRLASELLADDWTMTRDELSPCFTTRWNELPII
ncbi:Y-family DNA polymerase [Snodgrassella sp. CFCC 13594]|uniref:Y-family DNA polymerase n=1 Tax=Snodgrassella sp. CFCC 13594 TaxID=1775559 RepID=UPI001E2D0871|nr:Y-family DNA polymerase [Snodgrassella sp. CFCC 13594]